MQEVPLDIHQHWHRFLLAWADRRCLAGLCGVRLKYLCALCTSDCTVTDCRCSGHHRLHQEPTAVIFLFVSTDCSSIPHEHVLCQYNWTLGVQEIWVSPLLPLFFFRNLGFSCTRKTPGGPLNCCIPSHIAAASFFFCCSCSISSASMEMNFVSCCV